jgi:plastocyanin
MTSRAWWYIGCCTIVLTGCSKAPPEAVKTEAKAPPPAYFKVDPATAGTVTGTIHYTGKKPKSKPIDMSGDPACVEAHHGKAIDESLVVGKTVGLANVFVYIKSGLEGKTFETPDAVVAMDQQGCSFQPRLLGIQTGQTMRVTNSDPVTHNIHPLAQNNREWNHSQGAGEEPLARKFMRPEVMIRVKCNIHSWMRAYIGVVEHPYFAVTKEDGSFQIPNLPPGNYVLEAWHESLGTQEQPIQIAPSGKVETNFTFKGVAD